MANQPQSGQGGLPPYQLPHSFSQTFQSGPHFWPTHGVGIMPIFQQIPRAQSPLQGHAHVGQPVFHPVPTLNYPSSSNPSPSFPPSSNTPPSFLSSSNFPPRYPASCNPPPNFPLPSNTPPSYPSSSNPPPSYPSPGHSVYVPTPTEHMELKSDYSQPVQYSCEGSLFVTNQAEKFEACERAVQYAGDLALRHAAAKAAKNGITMEAPPSSLGSVSRAETQQSFSSQGFHSSLSQSCGSTVTRPFFSPQRSSGLSSHPQQPALVSTSSGCPALSESGRPAMFGCATSVAETGLPASSLAKIFPMAMCSGLYEEHFSATSNKQNTMGSIESPGVVMDVSPFGRIKRPLDIKVPEAHSSASAKSLNPSVAEFTPNPASRLSSTSSDVDSCRDVFSDSRSEESSTTELKVKVSTSRSQRNSADLNCNNNSPTIQPASASPADKRETETDTTAETSRTSAGWSTWKPEKWAEDWADKRHKSCQTECPVQGERKKGMDNASSSRKVIHLQAEVCRLRAQLCLNELQRQRFHVELDMFWWKSSFQPVVPSPVSRTMALAQTQLQDLMIQMRQIEMQRDHCLSILKSGRELLEVPNFTINLNSGETVTPINATGKDVVPFGASPTPPSTPHSKASPLPPPTPAVPTSDTPTCDEASSRKKQRLEEPSRKVPCTPGKSTIPPEARDDRPAVKIGRLPASLSTISSISTGVEAMSLAVGVAAFSSDQGVTSVAEPSCASVTSAIAARDLSVSQNLDSEAVFDSLPVADISVAVTASAFSCDITTSHAVSASSLLPSDATTSHAVSASSPIPSDPTASHAVSASSLLPSDTTTTHAVFASLWLPSDTTTSCAVSASSPLPSDTTASHAVSASSPLPSDTTTSHAVSVSSPLPSDTTTSHAVCESSPLPSDTTTLHAVSASSPLPSDTTTSHAVSASSPLPSDTTTCQTVSASSPLPSDTTTSHAVSASSPLPSDTTTCQTVSASSPLPSDTTASHAVSASTLFPSDTITSETVSVLSPSCTSDVISTTVCAALSSSDTSFSVIYASAMSSNDATTTAVCTSTLLSGRTTSTGGGAPPQSFNNVSTATPLHHLMNSANETADADPKIRSDEVCVGVDSQRLDPQSPTPQTEDAADIEEMPPDCKEQEMSTSSDEQSRVEDEERTSDISNKSIEVFHDAKDLLSELDDSGGKDNYSSSFASDMTLGEDMEHVSGSSLDKQISSQPAAASAGKAANSDLNPSEASSEGDSGLVPGTGGSTDTQSSIQDSPLSSEGSRASRGSVSSACSTVTDLPQGNADQEVVASDTGGCRTSPCELEPESSAAVCAEETVSAAKKVDETTDVTMRSAQNSDNQTCELEEIAEVVPKDGSDAQLDMSGQMHSAEADLLAKETDMFAVESDSDDEPPSTHKEILLTESASMADDLECVNTEMAAASLSDDMALSAAPSKPVADPRASQALQGEEDACAAEPPLKETSGEEVKVEGGRRETDAEQVLQSVTDRLKELYPKEAMDAMWLQKTAEEQTRLFLQQLDILAEEVLPSSNGNTAATVKQSAQLSPKQTKNLQQTLQPALQERMQQPCVGQTRDALLQKEVLRLAPAMGHEEDVLGRKEEILAEHKEAMTRQNQTLAKAAAIQQALLSLNRCSLDAPGNARLTAEIESKLKEYQSLLDDAESLGRKVARLDHQLRSVQTASHLQQPTAPFSLPLRPPAAPPQPVSGCRPAFVSTQATYPRFFRPQASLVLGAHPSLGLASSAPFQSSAIIPAGPVATAFPSPAEPGSLYGSAAFNSTMIPVAGNSAPSAGCAYHISTSLPQHLPSTEAHPPCSLSLDAAAPSASVPSTSAFKEIDPCSTVLGAASTQAVTPGPPSVGKSSVTCGVLLRGMTTVPSSTVTFTVAACSAAQSASSQNCPRPLTPIDPASSTDMTVPATSASSPQAFKPLLPLKPIKVSTNRYAALAVLGSSRLDEDSEKGVDVPKSRTTTFPAAKSSAAESAHGSREKRTVGFEPDEDAFTSSKRRITLRDDGHEVDDLQGDEENDWQISTSRRHRGVASTKNSGEHKRGTTPPVTSRARHFSRDKDRCSRSSSSDSFSAQSGPARLASTHSAPTSVAGSRSPLMEENWDDECDPFPTLRGMNPAPSNKLHFSGISPRARPPPVPPSLRSVKVKPGPPAPSSLLSVQLADTSTAGASAPQLDRFSFSKNLNKEGATWSPARPNINKGFIGRLVHNNEVSNLGRENTSGDAPSKNQFSKGWKSDGGGADGGAQSNTAVEEWLTVGKKGKSDSASGVRPQEKVECAGDVARAAAAKGPTRLTCFQKLCLSIEASFPNLKQEDIYRVIDEVKQSYGGHFHGKLFSGIMKDIRTVVLRDFSNSLRPTPQTMPVFTNMSTQNKERKMVSEKKCEEIWQQPSQTGTLFKACEDECSICLNEFLPGARYPLECGHTFHKQCIDKWVKNQGERTCPICRNIVLMSEDFPPLSADGPPSACVAAPPVETFSCHKEDFPPLGS